MSLFPEETHGTLRFEKEFIFSFLPLPTLLLLLIQLLLLLLLLPLIRPVDLQEPVQPSGGGARQSQTYFLRSV